MKKYALLLVVMLSTSCSILQSNSVEIETFTKSKISMVVIIFSENETIAGDIEKGAPYVAYPNPKTEGSIFIKYCLDGICYKKKIGYTTPNMSQSCKISVYEKDVVVTCKIN